MENEQRNCGTCGASVDKHGCFIPDPDVVYDVLRFMEKFRQDVPPAPSVPRRGIQELREKLVFEEYHEFRQAMFEQDLVRLADACCDLIYVIVGTALAYGIDLRPIWAAVQRSNMEKMPYDSTFAKKLEEQGITIPLGKVMKPVGWKEPDVAGLIASQVQRGNGLMETIK